MGPIVCLSFQGHGVHGDFGNSGAATTSSSSSDIRYSSSMNRAWALVMVLIGGLVVGCSVFCISSNIKYTCVVQGLLDECVNLNGTLPYFFNSLIFSRWHIFSYLACGSSLNDLPPAPLYRNSSFLSWVVMAMITSKHVDVEVQPVWCDWILLADWPYMEPSYCASLL